MAPTVCFIFSLQFLFRFFEIALYIARQIFQPLYCTSKLLLYRKKLPCQHLCIRCSLVGTPVLQTAAMLDCLVTIKAAMNVLQKSKNEIALVENDTTISLLQRFFKVIVDVLKNGRIDFFSKIHHIFIFLSQFDFIQPQC